MLKTYVNGLSAAVLKVLREFGELVVAVELGTVQKTARPGGDGGNRVR